jgi:exopolyphosphatase/guanosine-5'-triphosphate,3'-diphosphate pyrophosphatase
VPLIADDILEESTQNVLRLFSVNIEHNRHVADLALSMFDGWHGLHGLGRQYRKILKTAALLHDIGITINYYSHARHSAYMILNAKIFGLTHAEQMLCAVTAGWHNGIAKRYFKNHAYRPLLTEKDWDIAGKLALLLALAESLDYSESNTVTALVPGTDTTAATLEIHTAENAAVEMQQLQALEDWFAETFGLPLRTIIKSETPAD